MPDPEVPAATAAPAPAPAAPAVPAPAASDASVVTPSPAPAPAGAPAAAGPAPTNPPAPVPAPAAAGLGEIKLELPKDSKLTQADVDTVTALAVEKGLTQAQAEVVLQQRADAISTTASRVAEGFKATQTAWVEQIRKDPELGGGNDAMFAANMEHARLGLKQLIPDADLAEIEKHGFGNMPWLLRAGMRHYNTTLKSPEIIDGQPVKVTAPAVDDNSLGGWASDLYKKPAAK